MTSLALTILFAAVPAFGPGEIGTASTPVGPRLPLRLAQAGRVAVGRAPVVAGNLAAARERALDDALRQAVQQALADLGGGTARTSPGDPAGAQPAAAVSSVPPALATSILSRARSYVRRYRVLGQGPQASGYEVQVDAEIDGAALRRDVERLLPTPAAPPAAGQPALVIIPSGPAEGATALATALTAAGVRLGAPPAGVPTVAATVTAFAAPEGTVRGTGQVSVQCRLTARLTTGAGGPVMAEETASTRAFAEHDDAARRDCFARAAGELAARLAPALAASVAPSAESRTVTLDVDVVEPAALPALLKVLRGVGSVSSAELRRILAGRAEIRVGTRLSAPALAAAAVRDARPTLAVSNVETVGDVVRMRVRAAADGAASPASAAPSPGAP